MGSNSNKHGINTTVIDIYFNKTWFNGKFLRQRKEQCPRNPHIHVWPTGFDVCLSGMWPMAKKYFEKSNRLIPCVYSSANCVQYYNILLWHEPVWMCCTNGSMIIGVFASVKRFGLRLGLGLGLGIRHLQENPCHWRTEEYRESLVRYLGLRGLRG